MQPECSNTRLQVGFTFYHHVHWNRFLTGCEEIPLYCDCSVKDVGQKPWVLVLWKKNSVDANMRLQQCELDQWSWYLPKLLSPLVQKSLFVLQCLSSAWKLHYGNPKRDFCTEECNFGRFVKQLKPHISLNFWIKSIFTHHDLCLDSYNYIRGGSVDSQYGQEEQIQQVKTVSKYICEYWAKIDFKKGEPVL